MFEHTPYVSLGCLQFQYRNTGNVTYPNMLVHMSTFKADIHIHIVANNGSYMGPSHYHYY